MKKLVAGMFFIFWLFVSLEANALGPNWSFSDTTQVSSTFSREFDSCSSFQKVHLKVKNNSGTIDVVGVIHESQCYQVTISTYGKKRSDHIFNPTPISIDTIEVCSGDTQEMDTKSFSRWEYEDLMIKGGIVNKKSGFPKLGSCDLEIIALVYPINDHILFAHGLGSSKTDFDNYTAAAKLVGANVYRTDVERCGAIETRATELANYIKNLEDVPGNSLKVVGHSMGGLDLRYIVSKANEGAEPFLSAAKKIKKVYTIATPHGGNFMADKTISLVACHNEPGMKDLTNEAMDKFNKDYPYSTFNVEGRSIPFLAFYFQCWSCGGVNDCVVGTNGQTWKGAPQYSTALSGKHSNDLTPGSVGAGCTAELDNIDEVLCVILNDQ